MESFYYSTDQVDAVIEDILQRVQANKISIHGSLFFIPKQFLALLNLLEDYIAAIREYNLNPGLVMSNSMFVVDDERQRQKMTDEFYANYKKGIKFYQERVQHFIDRGCESKAVSSVGWIRSTLCSRKRLLMKQSFSGALTT